MQKLKRPTKGKLIEMHGGYVYPLKKYGVVSFYPKKGFKVKKETSETYNGKGLDVYFD